MVIEADPVCRNCGKTMRRVAEIAPAANSLGLRAFRCERCGISGSVLTHQSTSIWRRQYTDRKDRVSDFA
jgi:tRNA(Ile2) C34 agmatinyltransferase TiaS